MPEVLLNPLAPIVPLDPVAPEVPLDPDSPDVPAVPDVVPEDAISPENMVITKSPPTVPILLSAFIAA